MPAKRTKRSSQSLALLAMMNAFRQSSISGRRSSGLNGDGLTEGAHKCLELDDMESLVGD